MAASEGMHFKPKNGAGSMPAASSAGGAARASRPMSSDIPVIQSASSNPYARRPAPQDAAGRIPASVPSPVSHGASAPNVPPMSRAAGVQPYAPAAQGARSSAQRDARGASGQQSPYDARQQDARDARRPASSGAAYARGASPYSSGGSRGSGSKPPRRKGNVLSTMLIVLGVVLLVAAGGLFVHAQMGYKQAADFYENLNKEAISDTAGEGIPNIDFDALKKVNEDVVGWIYIPGTNINHVVAQGDTNDTYLRTLINGEYNANGTVFLDMDDTAPGVVDQQTTLYGHHMNDGSMFSYINETLKQDAFDTIKKVYYITPDATYEFAPMFTMKVEDDFVDARRTNFEGDGGLAQYLSDSLKHASAQSKDAKQQVKDAKQVLTLVTCDDAFLAKTKRATMVCTLVGTVGGQQDSADQASEAQDPAAQPAPDAQQEAPAQ